MWSQLRRKSALPLAMSLLAVAVAGCGGSGSGTEGPRGEMAHAGSDKLGEPQSAEVTKQIVIDNFTFDPPTLTIPVGTKVTWVNHDDVPHTATSTAKPKHFESGTLDTDDKFSHMFTIPGTFEYFCAVHPKMTGRIIVK
jgi:plastocyanin